MYNLYKYAAPTSASVFSFAGTWSIRLMGNLGVMVIFFSLAFISIFQRKRFREIVNQIYYGEPRFAAIELAKLFINSTIGAGGLRDCAKERFGINGRYADLGQTLRPTTYISTSEWFSPISVGLYVHEKINDTSFHQPLRGHARYLCPVPHEIGRAIRICIAGLRG